MFDKIKSLFKSAAPEAIKEEPDKNEKLMAFDSYIYRGSDFSYYNPDDLIIKKGEEVYENMMADDQVKAVLAFKRSSVVARGYYFDVQSGNEQHEKIAEFFQFVIDNMKGSFSDKIKSMLSAYHNGFSICEKVYDSTEWDGSQHWVVKDIKKKPFSTFTFKVDDVGEILDLIQSTNTNEISVPMEKVIHFVYQPEHDIYYGRSDLRACYRGWFSKDMTIRFQNIHLERHASGIIVVTAGEGADSTQTSAIKKILKNISIRTGIYLPRGYTAQVISPQTTDAYEKAIAQHDKSIAKGALVPNLLGLSEQGQVGSFSQSKTQFEVFLWLIDCDTSSLEEVLNEQMFKELALWNFGTDDFPKFKMGELDASQKTELAKTWSQLVKDGAVTNTGNDEQYTRSLLGYPELDEEAVEDDEPGDTPPEEPTNDEILDNLPEGLDADPFIQAFKDRPWLRRVKFKQIDKSMDDIESGFVSDLNAILGLVRLAIENQIKKVAGDRSFGNIELKEFNGLMIPKGLLSKIAKDSRTNLQKMFNSSYTLAKGEIQKKEFAQLIGMDKTRADRFLAAKSLKIKDVLNADILKNVKQILENGIKYDKSLASIMNELETNSMITSVLPSVDAAGRTLNIPARLENIVRTNTADAVNQARMSLFGDPRLKGFVQAFEYSAILDSRVTDICESLHGRIKREWGEYLPPNHFQCRSILVPVTIVDEWDGNEDNIPTNVKPAVGFA